VKCTVLVCAVAVLPVAAAHASRAPTPGERAAIVRALPAYVRAIPDACVSVSVRVSDSGSHALARPRFATARRCAPFAADGYWILRRARTWRVVFTGADPPSCSLRVPRDLTTCRPG
jgi:hypothetical protein